MSKIISNLLVCNLILKVHKSLSSLERLSALSTYQQPTSFLLVTRPVMAPGILFFSSTLKTILVTMMKHGVPMNLGP